MPRRELGQNGRTRKPEILGDVGSETEGLESDFRETERGREREAEREFDSAESVQERRKVDSPSSSRLLIIQVEVELRLDQIQRPVRVEEALDADGPRIRRLRKGKEGE